MAEILTAQGQGQRLRILSLGASTLDEKAMTYLSLNTLQEMAKGEATKILFPFEVSRLMEGASEYLGASRQVPSREPTEVKDLEDIVGKAEDILGEIPGRSEMREQISEIEKKVGKETDKDRKEIQKEAEKDAKEVLEEVREEVGELKLNEEKEEEE
jgi:hypothetical protein